MLGSFDTPTIWYRHGLREKFPEKTSGLKVYYYIIGLASENVKPNVGACSSSDLFRENVQKDGENFGATVSLNRDLNTAAHFKLL